MKKVILLTLLFVTQAVAESSPTINDFAMQRRLNAVSDSPLQTFVLPSDVYSTVTSSALHDVRIFNGTNSVVPFEIKNISSTSSSSQKSTPLTIFPIKGEVSADIGGSTTIAVSEDADGKIVSVHVDGDKKNSTEQNSYLIDLRAMKQGFDALRFQWASGDQMVPVTIQTSSDLKIWSTVASGVLAKLEYAGNTVNQNQIDAFIQPSGYLKISAPTGVPFEVRGVDGISNATDIVEPASLTQPLTQTEQPNGKTYLFDSGGLFPVRALNISFKEKNVLTQVAISSRADMHDGWTPRLTTTAYSLSTGGNAAVSGFQTLPIIVTDRYWKLETKEGESTLPSPPIVTARWTPHRVLFVAQGDGPFTLSYGSNALKSIPFQTDSVTTISHSLKVAPTEVSLQDPAIAGGTSLLTPPAPRPVVEWKKWILWGVLGIALLVVLGMAKSLFKELKGTRS